MENPLSVTSKPSGYSILPALLRRAGASLAILLVIAYLTLFGLTMAERGRKGLPAQPLNAAVETLGRTADYAIHHPATYYWHKENISALSLAFTLLGRSAGLLLVALGMAAIIGVPLGIIMALWRRAPAAPLMLLISVLGISTPSFGQPAGDGQSLRNPRDHDGEGKIGAPPYAPSAVFPWGTDVVGRDVRALVLAGAKQTMTLALFGMLARMLIGSIVGVFAGWWRNGWFDKLVSSAVAVWAAFPVTLFAMILILALGIQQGLSVFVITLCVVGWREIAQFVRGQVIGIKPQLYIEAARAIGARSGRILSRHVLPTCGRRSWYWPC